MSSRAQTALNQRTHIPAHIEQAMNQHLQSAMPAHLQKYVGADASYVPAAAQKQISQFMERSMPAHLKQYSGAYMQQNVVSGNTARLRSGPFQAKSTAPAPLPDKLRLEHSGAVGEEQFSVKAENLSAQNLFKGDSQVGPELQQTSSGPDYDHITPAANDQQAAPSLTDYEFITNPGQPKPGGGPSKTMRIVVVLGGLLVLVIVFAIIKNILAGPSNAPQLIAVAQEQHEILHLVGNTTQNQSQQQNLSTTSQNFAITAQATMTTAQQQLLTYLKKNGHKVNSKVLALKVSASLDSQLTAAQADTSYDQTFVQIMQAQLTTYQQLLKQAYSVTSGPKGRALLNDEYVGAQLLAQQLTSPSS